MQRLGDADINSEPTERLRGTSAGVGKASIWKKQIRVREINSDCLSIVLSDDNESDRRIRSEKKYL